MKAKKITIGVVIGALLIGLGGYASSFFIDLWPLVPRQVKVRDYMVDEFISNDFAHGIEEVELNGGHFVGRQGDVLVLRHSAYDSDKGNVLQGIVKRSGKWETQ